MVVHALTRSAFDDLFNPDKEDILHLGEIPRPVLDGDTIPVDSRRFLWCLVNCSPDPRELLNEISRCLPHEFVSSCHEDHHCTVSLDEFTRCRAALNDLSERFFTDLILPFRGIGETTPINSNPDSGAISPALNDTLEDELAALDAAALTNPDAMKTLIALRDGDRCLVTRHGFSSVLAPNCTHILPYSVQCRTKAHDLIELFTSGQVSSMEIRMEFNTPSNAIMLQSDAQSGFRMGAWGIEAIQHPTTGIWKYYYRVIDSSRTGPLIEIKPNSRLPFGSGLPSDPHPVPSSSSSSSDSTHVQPTVHSPNPLFCNTHLSLSRLAFLSGLSPFLDTLSESWDLETRTSDFMVDITGGAFSRTKSVKSKDKSRNRTRGQSQRKNTGEWRGELDVDVLWLKLKEVEDSPPIGGGGEPVYGREVEMGGWERTAGVGGRAFGRDEKRRREVVQVYQSVSV